MNPLEIAPEEPNDGGLGAFHCDGVGGCRPIALSETGRSLGSEEWLWVHLNHADPDHRRWLREDSGLDSLTCDALLEEETRPRLVAGDDHALLFVRGVNLNPGAAPVDMISLRIHVDGKRLISLRHRRLFAIQAVRKSLLAGKGPRSTSAMLATIIDRLVDLQAGVVGALEEDLDTIEQNMVENAGPSLRVQIAEFRRQAISLRRYIAPQRDVLSRLYYEQFEWLSERPRARLREVADQQLRLVEEVDAARERASVAHEELNGRLSELMNRNMYVLAVVTGVFLPLGLLTGLLGINVGGMPGVEYPHAFWIVCGILSVLAVVMVWLFRRIRLL